jgi:hypothetical protein
MKIVGDIVLFGLFLYLPLHAEVVEPTLKELVSKVKNAPDDQKRVLMNELKTQLKKMSKESRKEAMIELKKSFATKEKGHKRHQKRRGLKKHHLNHQPKFRHLQRGQGTHQPQHNGQGDGHK